MERKSIVVNYSPFVMEQSVYYWENADCIEHRKCSIDDVPDMVQALKKKYQVRQIDLAGPADYLNKFKEIMSSKDYDFDDCTINIINR